MSDFEVFFRRETSCRWIITIDVGKRLADVRQISRSFVCVAARLGLGWLVECHSVHVYVQ